MPKVHTPPNVQTPLHVHTPPHVHTPQHVHTPLKVHTLANVHTLPKPSIIWYYKGYLNLLWHLPSTPIGALRTCCWHPCVYRPLDSMGNVASITPVALTFPAGVQFQLGLPGALVNVLNSDTKPKGINIVLRIVTPIKEFSEHYIYLSFLINYHL